MDTMNMSRSLSSKLIELLMNTIGLFHGRHHLSEENARLHQQLNNYNQLYEENTKLRNELLRSQNQTHENAVLCQQMAEIHQTPSTDSTLSANPRSPQPTVPSPISDVKPTDSTVPPAQTCVQSHSDVPQNVQDTEEDTALRAEIAQYREKHVELLERYAKLNEEMKRKKIDSFEALAEHDKEAMKVFIELARLTEPIPMEGINIGLFGLTSTGKSTMLNTLLGSKVAETGVGETTTKIKPYNGTKFTLWDVPGRNDEVSYFSMEYISFFKGLSRRLILIQATVKENSSMMKLLDEIGLQYDIVFNKFDKVDEDEQDAMKKKIPTEIQQLNLKGVNKIYFVSAKNPKMFDDWLAMVNDLTT